MTIESLKEKYPLVAKAYMRNIDKNTPVFPTYISEGFLWEDSPEGVEFWYCMDEGMIDEAKKLQPSLFIDLREILKKL